MSKPSWSDLLAGRYVSPGQPWMVVHLSQRIGAVLAALAFRLGLSPNLVTLSGLAVMLLGCVAYAWGSVAGWGIAALLWQLGFAFDCADGQLARATRGGNAFGAWLDVVCDYIRQTAVTLTLVYTLVLDQLPLLNVLLACFLLHAGFSVYLYTAISMNAGKPPALSVSGWKQGLRVVVQNSLDTPPYLLLICLLAPWPKLLAVYVSGYGVLLLFRGAAIARSRL